jgi:hypothetical protein
MKLPFFLKLNKKKPIFFLVLVLRSEKVNAVIFEELKGKIQIVGQHEEYLENSIDSISSEELLDMLDKTVSKAESTLPESSETQKTIFGVKEDWVENDKIKKEHLLKLKRVSDELGLTPIGFLIISQAISYLLQKEEGAPPSAILVDAGKRFVTVSLIRSGKIIETRSGKIEDNTSYTVDNLLKHFTASETLPSRIVIFDGQKDLSQEFISHQWNKSLPFLHLPQIINLNVGFEAKAILFGVATQMGFEVLEDVGSKAKAEVSEEQPPTQFENLSMENFGFVKDVDVTKTQAAKVQEISNIQSPHIPSKTTISPNLGQTALVKIFQAIKKIPIRGFLRSFPIPTINNKSIIFIPILVVVLLLGFVLFYFFGTKATVSLEIKPKIIKQNNSATFSTVLPTNEDNSIIGGESVSVSLDGSVSTPATGKKDVGNKAKGIVTVFNNTSSSKVFQKGAITTSSNGLDFTLDSSVNAASASGDAFGTTPGKAKVNVLATKIGTEYNLPSNTKFSIGDYPLIAAKNDDPFEGGTKKTIAVVSKNDIDKLLQELPKSLAQKAKEELNKQTPSDEALLPIFLAPSVAKKDFDKDVDDQGDKITLKGTVVYKGISYKKKDLISQSVSLIKKNVAMDQVLDENNIKVDIKDIKQKNEKEADANLDIEAILQPKFDENKLISEITGMSYKDAEKLLLKLPQSSSVNISSSLDIPFIPKMLPRISKNIKIVVKTHD